MTGDHRAVELPVIGMAMIDRGVAVQVATLPEDVWMFEDTKRFAKAIKVLAEKGENADLMAVMNLIGSENDDVTTLMEAGQLGFTSVGYKQKEAILYRNCLCSNNLYLFNINNDVLFIC